MIAFFESDPWYRLVERCVCPLSIKKNFPHHCLQLFRYVTMPRELDEKDRAILKKLAPECGDLTCSGSGHSFHSILPPVSNHFAEDSEDFVRRINRLSDEELTYITEMIRKGKESMGCLPVEDVEALVKIVHDRLSPEIAKQVISAFESGYECEH
jgi:hypothetical protein